MKINMNMNGILNQIVNLKGLKRKNIYLYLMKLTNVKIQKQLIQKFFRVYQNFQ